VLRKEAGPNLVKKDWDNQLGTSPYLSAWRWIERGKEGQKDKLETIETPTRRKKKKEGIDVYVAGRPRKRKQDEVQKTKLLRLAKSHSGEMCYRRREREA